jgi:hypothetical protein
MSDPTTLAISPGTLSSKYYSVCSIGTLGISIHTYDLFIQL